MAGDCCSMQEMYEMKRHEHVSELQKKEEETRQMFVVRVKEKEAELKDAEKEVSLRPHPPHSERRYTFFTNK